MSRRMGKRQNIKIIMCFKILSKVRLLIFFLLITSFQIEAIQYGDLC